MKELGQEDCSEVLTQAIAANARKVELYYLAARIELSRGCATPPGGSGAVRKGKGGVSVVSARGGSSVDNAVEWLVKCVRRFYVDTPPEMSTKLVLVLYR